MVSMDFLGRKTLTLDSFLGQLELIYGSLLKAVIMYGSAAAAEEIAGVSDINLLILVDSIPVEVLGRSGQTVRAWMEAGNPPPFVMTVREWEQSSDIYPMEYADIAERHRILYGEIDLTGITIQPEDLRLQLEHEGMSRLLRLRRGVMAAGTDAGRQRSLMLSSFSTFMAIFRAVERLAHGAQGDVSTRDRTALIRQVALRAGFDPKPFERVAALVSGGSMPESETSALLGAYVSAIEILVAHIDGLGPTPGAGSPPGAA